MYTSSLAYYRHVLLQPNGDDKWTLPDRNKQIYEIDLVLPSGISCSQCILQVLDPCMKFQLSSNKILWIYITKQRRFILINIYLSGLIERQIAGVLIQMERAALDVDLRSILERVQI